MHRERCLGEVALYSEHRRGQRYEVAGCVTRTDIAPRGVVDDEGQGHAQTAEVHASIKQEGGYASDLLRSVESERDETRRATVVVAVVVVVVLLSSDPSAAQIRSDCYDDYSYEGWTRRLFLGPLDGMSRRIRERPVGRTESVERTRCRYEELCG